MQYIQHINIVFLSYSYIPIHDFMVIFKVVLMARLVFGLYNYVMPLIFFLGLKSQNK